MKAWAGVPNALEQRLDFKAMLRNFVDAVAVLWLPEHVDEMAFSIGVLLAQTQRVLEQLIDVEVRRLALAGACGVERL